MVGEFEVSFFHFFNCPAECAGSLFRVCHNGYEQMRYAVVRAKLHDLRVYHNELHLVRLCLIQNTCDNRVYAYALTGTRSAGNEQMRSFGNIHYNRAAVYVTAYGYGKLGRMIFKFRSFKHCAHIYGGYRIVGNFYADAARQYFDSYVARRQAQRNITVERRNLVYFDTLGRQNLVSCNARTSRYIRNSCLYSEAFENIYQFCGTFFQLCQVSAGMYFRCFAQKRCFGHFVIVV